MNPLSPISRLQQDECFLNQPASSPASTNGQTLIGGDSVPATPGSDFVNETHKMARTETNDFNEEPHYVADHFNNPPSYRIEVMLDRCKNATTAVRTGLGLATSDSCPAALASMIQGLSINRSHRSSTDYFVQHDQSENDDVFDHRDAEMPEPLTPQEVSGDEYTAEQDKGAEAKDTESSNLYSPRPDKKGHKVTADNAQAHLKPECCIFVANLPSARPDAIIGSALNEVFARFGKCFVKLKRDRGMPIAFVQYDNSADASQALDQGAGLIILGRKCRTERAKAPRCVYVSRRDGAMPTEGEVVDLVSSRGEIEKTWAPTETEQEIHKLPPGFFVRFAYYQDAVDAMNALRDIPMYNVEAQQAPRSPTPLFDPASILVKPHPKARPPLFDPSKHDNRALWIGDLPEATTKSDLARVFGGQGRQIRYIELRIRSNTARAGFTSFAFVHYVDPRAAYMTACMTHNTLRLFNRRCVRIQFARRPYWQLFGNMPATPVRQNMAHAMNGFNTTPQNFNPRGSVPPFNGQHHLASYGHNFANEHSQANYYYNPELSYDSIYMPSDMDNLSAAYPYQLQDLSGGHFMLPHPQMSIVAPSSFAGPYLSS